MSKRKAEIHHSRMRCLQRYGFDLSKQKQLQIVKKIQSHEAVFIKRQSNRVTLFYVDCEDKKLKVVYDKLRKSLITVLPS